MMSIGFAYLLGSISLPDLGWIGVGLIFLSIMAQAGAATGLGQNTRKKSSQAIHEAVLIEH
jgi:hypothetical protein